MKTREEFYDSLKVKLSENTQFPTKYMFKFIVPTNGNQSTEVLEIFDNLGAVVTTNKSKTGKFISFSIVLKVDTVEEVIVHYRSVEHIEGLLSL